MLAEPADGTQRVPATEEVVQTGNGEVIAFLLGVIHNLDALIRLVEARVVVVVEGEVGEGHGR